MDPRLVPALSRLVSSLIGASDGAAARGALAEAMEHLASGSVTLRAEGRSVTVDGHSLPVETAEFLASRLAAHGVRELRIAHPASALDLLQLARRLAQEPGNRPLGAQPRPVQPGTIEAVSHEPLAAVDARRAVSVDEALASLAARDSDPAARAPNPADRTLPRGAPKVQPFTPGIAVTAEQPIPRQVRLSSRVSLAADVRRVMDVTDPEQVLQRLSQVMASLDKAMKESRMDTAIDAVVTMIEQEKSVADSPDIRSRYDLTLSRLFRSPFLKQVPQYLLDPVYARDATRIILRSGHDGTSLLLDRLAAADTFAERRAFMEVLRQIDEGKQAVVSMLDHREWFVIRNIADLVGELRIEEGIPALGRAIEHADKRVRASAGVALAKIGTPQVARFVFKAMSDADRQVRLEVSRQVGGRGLAGLVLPISNLIQREQDDEVREEYYRALGRIGTPEAVRVLTAAAEPAGLLKRGRTTRERIAAVEGLAQAAGDMQAMNLLQELTKDRIREIRDIAVEAVKDAGARESRS